MLYYYATGYGANMDEVSAEVCLLRALIASGDLELIESAGTISRRVYVLSTTDDSNADIYMDVLVRKFKHLSTTPPTSELACMRKHEEMCAKREGIAWVLLNDTVQVQEGNWVNVDLYTWLRVHCMLTLSEYRNCTCGVIADSIITIHTHEKCPIDEYASLLHQLLLLHSNLYDDVIVEILNGYYESDSDNVEASLNNLGMFKLEGDTFVHVRQKNTEVHTAV